MRKKIVAGNWKMNTTPLEGVALAKELTGLSWPNDVDLIIAPPFTHLSLVQDVVNSTKIGLSSQNIAKENMGAYTGEISAEMLKDLSVSYAIIGHSERRSYYSESNIIVAEKTKKALEFGITPIVCVGENLEERESGRYFEVIKEQVELALFELSAEDIQQVIIAYEPVWAIGTGKTASPEEAQEVHAYIRSMLLGKYTEEIAQKVSVLYGGSCKPSNAKELFSKPDIDGGLIGGAALQAKDFIAIANSF